jgi:predicted short-subunit dehydrogenase-like oxidoreductase (DUF2520 family)
VARGDAGTVATHLGVLDALAPDIRPAYAAHATATARRALRTGRLRPDQAAPILDLTAPDDPPPSPPDQEMR